MIHLRVLIESVSLDLSVSLFQGAIVVSVPGSSVLAVTVTPGSESLLPELAYQMATTTTTTSITAAIRVPGPTRPSSTGVGLASLMSRQYPTLRLVG